MFQVFEDGIQKKVVVDDEPFTETKNALCKCKVLLKGSSLSGSQVENSIPIRKVDVTKRFDIATEKVGVMTEKNQLPLAMTQYLRQERYVYLRECFLLFIISQRQIRSKFNLLVE